MTGYGRGAGAHEDIHVTVEARSVNHRYVDIKLRGAAFAPAIEEAITSAIKKRIARGSLQVSVRIESAAGTSGLAVDIAAALRVKAQLQALAEALQLEDRRPISLQMICNQPGVIASVDLSTRADDILHALRPAVDTALDGLIAMRDTEGRELAEDFRTRAGHLESALGHIETAGQTSAADVQQRLRDRIAKIMPDDIEVDEARIAHEVAIIADRTDITEEIVRLRSHLKQLEAMLSSGEDAIGRKIGFLVQEFGREFNTIGSKSQSADIAKVIVDAKAELEKMREQVQNIE